MREIDLKTERKTQLLDITARVEEALASTNGATAATCTANDTTRGAVNKSVALAHCTLNNLTPDVYELTATIGGSYFQGSGLGARPITAGFRT